MNSNSAARLSSIKEDGLLQLSRSIENAKRIKSVQDKFVNSQPLMKEGRALVGEGILIKVCRKKSKQRVFFLFNDILVYGRVVINGHKYSQQKIIPLNEIQITSRVDFEESPYSWLISSPKKSFIVRANSDREREEWLSHLNRCIQYACGGDNIRHNTLAAHWIPDDKSDICMCCQISKFSTYNRKHHCRNCGYLVCERCSKKRFLLPHLDSKRVRVCDMCFVKLNENITSVNTHANVRDTSDSDGEENSMNYPPVSTTFYRNIDSF